MRSCRRARPGERPATAGAPVGPRAARRSGRPLAPTRRCLRGRSAGTHARTASMIASTASPSSLPAGVTAPSSRSSEHVRLIAHARRLCARRLPARNQPRTVPGGRPSRRAITRCPTPKAARRSASPITSAPSRRRGTSHEGESTCVVSHAAQRARRGAIDRAPCNSRTSRERANPHGESRAEHAGHASSPAARAASTRSRGDRDREHRRLSTRSPSANPSRCRDDREGASRVAHLPDGRPRGAARHATGLRRRRHRQRRERSISWPN